MKNKDVVSNISNYSPQKLERICKKMGTALGYNFKSKEFLTKNENGFWEEQETTFISNGLKLKHLRGELTLSLPIFEHTKFVHIDTKDLTRKQIQIVVNGLGNNPVLISRNPKNKHYHLFFLFEDYINTSGKREIEDYFKGNHGIHIRVLNHGDYFRVPFSEDYSEHGVYDPESKNLIQQIEDIETCIDLFNIAKPTRLSDIIKIKNAADSTALPFVRKDIYTGKPKKTNRFPTIKDILYTNQKIRLSENEFDLDEYLKVVYRGLQFGKEQGKVEKEYIEAAITTYWFNFQKQSYERSSERTYKHKHHKYQKLNDAASFSYIFSQEFKKHFGIKRNIRRVLSLLENSMLANRVRLEDGYTKSFAYYSHPTHFHCHAIELTEYQAQKRLYNLFVTSKVFFDNLNLLDETTANNIRSWIKDRILSGISESHWGKISEIIANKYLKDNQDLYRLFIHFSTIKNCEEYLNMTFPYPHIKYNNFKVHLFDRFAPGNGKGDIISLPQGCEDSEVYRLFTKHITKKNRSVCTFDELNKALSFPSYPFINKLYKKNPNTQYHLSFDVPQYESLVAYIDNDVIKYKYMYSNLASLYTNNVTSIILPKLHDKKIERKDPGKYMMLLRKQLKIPILYRNYPQYPQEPIKYKTEREIQKEVITQHLKKV